MRRGTLLTQVLTVNLLLIAAAVIAASLASNPDSPLNDSATIGLVLGLTLSAAVAVNVYMLSRRFEPLEHLVEEMERADLSGATKLAAKPPEDGPEEVRRLNVTFHEMLTRLESERRAVASAALEAQERERSRIALDLHDEVNQSLTGVLLRIEALRRTAPPELRDELAETRSLAAQAMEELLALAHRLRPASLDDLGLRAAVAGLVDENGRATDLETTFESSGDLSGIAPDVQLVTYRVAQEALSNALHHAGARRIQVELSGEGETLELRVRDDGSGFDSGQSAPGLGLAGMRERALLIGGTLDVRSHPGDGTEVTLRTKPADAG